MIREIRGVVLVDDLPAVDGVYPAHGLSVLLELTGDEGATRILFDSGHSLELLRRNAASLGVELGDVDLFFGSLPSSHHVGAALRGRLAARYETPWEHAETPPGVEVVESGSYWGERGLLVDLGGRKILFTGCSVHGFEETWGWLAGGLWGVVGGLGLSMRDVHGLEFLRRLVEGGLEVVFPLHSVSPEAREYILDRLLDDRLGVESTGVGVEFTIR